MADQHDLARELPGLAQDDLVAAEALLDVAVVSDAIVGFHAQQAVEKAFKAVLAGRRVTFPFTHNIGLLMTLVEDAGILGPALPGRCRSPDALWRGPEVWGEFTGHGRPSHCARACRRCRRLGTRAHQRLTRAPSGSVQRGSTQPTEAVEVSVSGSYTSCERGEPRPCMGSGWPSSRSRRRAASTSSRP